jgi:hypothetical protein
MDFKQKYLKYKTKYLNLKNNIIYSNKKQIDKRCKESLNLEGGNNSERGRGRRKNYILNDPNMMIMNNITGVDITDMAISAIVAIDDIEKKNDKINFLNINNTNTNSSNQLKTNSTSNNIIDGLVNFTSGFTVGYGIGKIGIAAYKWYKSRSKSIKVLSEEINNFLFKNLFNNQAYLIFSAGGGYDLFGSLPKIYEILRLNPNAKIIVISPSFCIGECASYFTNTTLDSKKSKYGRKVTDHCFEIVNGDREIIIKNDKQEYLYSPEKEFFAAIKTDFPDSNVRIFNIPAWFKYDNYDIRNDRLPSGIREAVPDLGVRATAEQYIEAIQKIIKICDVKSTELKIIIQDMGSDLLLNEKHLLEGNKRYGLASYVEEMTLIYVINYLIDTNYFISSLIYLCAVNLGGDVNCLMSKELLENTYKDAEHWKWTLNPSTIFYINALGGKKCNSIANASVITGLIADSNESDISLLLYGLWNSAEIDTIKNILKDKYNSDFAKNMFSALFLDGFGGPQSLALNRTFGGNINSENRITEIIIPWKKFIIPAYLIQDKPKYEYPNVSKSLMNFSFNEFTRWVDVFHLLNLTKDHTFILETSDGKTTPIDMIIPRNEWFYRFDELPIKFNARFGIIIYPNARYISSDYPDGDRKVDPATQLIRRSPVDFTWDETFNCWINSKSSASGTGDKIKQVKK